MSRPDRWRIVGIVRARRWRRAHRSSIESRSRASSVVARSVLVPPREPKEIAADVDRLLRDDESGEMGRAGRRAGPGVQLERVTARSRNYGVSSAGSPRTVSCGRILKPRFPLAAGAGATSRYSAVGEAGNPVESLLVAVAVTASRRELRRQSRRRSRVGPRSRSRFAAPCRIARTGTAS